MLSTARWHTFFNVACLHPGGIFGGPNTGIAIGLQLHANLKAISFGLAGARLRGPNLVSDPGQVLNMMSHFMGNDISIGKITTTAHLFQLVEETCVEINALISRTIKWSHRRLRLAAARLSTALVKAQLCRLVALASIGKHLRPSRFRRGENTAGV